jgi:hypothetical protein
MESKKQGKLVHIDRGKTINDEFIPLRKACPFIVGKQGECIKLRCLQQKAYRGDFPEGTITHPSHGNWFISKNYLLGLITEKPAA